ncbi:unnamed protein product [Pedinophyceae sp. YPF-701]|nr:unnamed protein product [Pedinophyceae sp. YPF-701]
MAQKPLFKGKKKTAATKPLAAKKSKPPSKHGKVGAQTKRGTVFRAPKTDAARKAFEADQLVRKFVNKKNENTAAAYASAHGGKLDVVKPPDDSFKLGKKKNKTLGDLRRAMAKDAGPSQGIPAKATQ